MITDGSNLVVISNAFCNIQMEMKIWKTELFIFNKHWKIKFLHKVPYTEHTKRILVFENVCKYFYLNNYRVNVMTEITDGQILGAFTKKKT